MKSKIIINIAGIIGSISLFLLVVFCAVMLPAMNMFFYEYEFDKNNCYERTSTDKQTLLYIMDVCADYLIGNREDMQVVAQVDGKTDYVYDDDELSHMADVKTLFVTGKNIAVFAGFVFVGCGVFLYASRKKITASLPKAALISFTAVIVVLAVVGISAAADFDAAFTVFHKIFFPQGNWLFPYGSFMITMLPESLFMDAALIILGISGAFSVAFFAVLIMCYRKLSKNRLDANPNGKDTL